MNYLRLDDKSKSMMLLLNRKHHIDEFGCGILSIPSILSSGTFLFPIKAMFILYLKYGITLKGDGRKRSDAIYNGLSDIIEHEVDELLLSSSVNVGIGSKRFGNDGLFEIGGYYHYLPDILEVDNHSRVKPLAKHKIEFPIMETWIYEPSDDFNIIDDIPMTFSIQVMKKEHGMDNYFYDRLLILPTILEAEQAPSSKRMMELITSIKQISPALLKINKDKFKFYSKGFEVD